MVNEGKENDLIGVDVTIVSEEISPSLTERENDDGPGCEMDTSVVVGVGAISLVSGKSIDVSKSPDPKPDPTDMKISGVLLTMFVITDAELGVGTELSNSAELENELVKLRNCDV